MFCSSSATTGKGVEQTNELERKRERMAYQDNSREQEQYRARDELQQKQAALEQACLLAAERANQLETVLETMTDAVLVLDRDEQVLFANKARRALSDRMNLSTPGETFQEQMKLFAPHTADGSPLPDDQWPILRALRGETFTGNDSVDIRFHAQQGEVRDLNMAGAPIRSDSGEIIGAVIVAREMTERRRQEQQTQRMLDTILNMIFVLEGGVTENLHSFMEQPDGDASLPPREKRSLVTYVAMQLAALTHQVLECHRVCILRLDLQAQELHPLASIGLSPALVEQWWADSPARRFARWLLVEPSVFVRLQQGEIVELDMSHLPSGGHDNLYRVSQSLLVPMFVQDRLVGLVGVDDDGARHSYSPQEKALSRGVAKLAALVIERQRLTQEQMEAHARELTLQEVNRQKDAFLSIVNHELKAPLTVVSTSLQFAQQVLSSVIGDVAKENDRALGKLQKVAKLLTTAMQQVEVQTRMVYDLLDFSSMQANQLRLQKTWCDLVLLVSEVIEEQQRNFPKRAFHMDLTGHEHIALFADGDRIKQVFNNYLTNAIKYTPAEKPIYVRLSLEERMVHVQVRDEGLGLLPEEVQHVWDRWYQGQGGKQMTGKGMSLGIGLSVCRMIIEQHQGQVGVETAPGAGANFWFTLPLAE